MDIEKQPSIGLLESIRDEINEIIDKKIEDLAEENYEEIESKLTKILKMIYDEGGTVSQERFHELGEKAGYDPRGLGGLFAWQGKGARLQKVKKIDKTEIVLTQKGLEYLRKKGVIDDE